MLTIVESLQTAVQHHRAGRLPQAERLYRQILRVDPRHVRAMHLLGLLAHQSGRSDLAVEHIREALRLQPELAEAHCNLGMALAKQERMDDAIACYHRALELKPDHAEAHNNLANALRKQGKLADAEVSYREAIRLQPKITQTHCNLGVVLLQQGQSKEAAACFRQALRLQPQYAEAHCNLGMALADQKKFNEAIACYHRALDLKPDLAEAHCNLGVALLKQEKPREAIACYQQAIRLKHDYAEAHSNLGVALAESGLINEAVGCYREALLHDPEFAESHVNLAFFQLIQGNFEEGWLEYEWRWKRKEFSLPPFPQPYWDGSSLEGKTILIFAEQGLGDTIQFIRYAPMLQQMGATVVALAQRPLVRLLATCPGIDLLLPEGEQPPAFDLQAPLLSLPRILRTNLATIPAPVPYLHASRVWAAHWRHEFSTIKKLKVGIAWQGNPDHALDRRRSLPLSAFAPLASLREVQLVSLQKGIGSEQLTEHGERLGVLDPTCRLADFADTAALMSNLDLVIAVDTAVAHLAGAVGVPVWLLLPQMPDWRWLLEREDSPWYPTMKLFRQSSWGDWAGVLEQVTETLKVHLRSIRGE